MDEVGADFHEELIALLEGELGRNPRRHDLRLKLLELYAATERKLAFVQLAMQHQGNVQPGAEDRVWPQIVEMGRRLVPEHELFRHGPPAASGATTPAAVGRRRYYESMPALALLGLQDQLGTAWQGVRRDVGFWKELRAMVTRHLGPSPPLTQARKISTFVGGAQILLRNETRRAQSEAAVTNALGQVLLAQRLGRRRVVTGLADPGHVLTVVQAASELGLQAEIVMSTAQFDARPAERTAIEGAGALIYVAPRGDGADDSPRAALTRALALGPDTFFASPIAAGPPPYPLIVRELQGLCGMELKTQINSVVGRAPDGLLVSASDGMQSIGFLQAFIAARDVRMFCVEAADGAGSRHHRLTREHGWLRASGRVRYSSVPEEVARFAARHCMPDDADVLGLSSGEVLVEAFTVARQFSARQFVVLVLPAEHPP